MGQKHIAVNLKQEEIKINGKSMPMWTAADLRDHEISETQYVTTPVGISHAFYSERTDWIIVIIGTTKIGICIMQAEEAMQDQQNVDGSISRTESWALSEQSEVEYMEAYARLEQLHRTGKNIPL